NGCAYELGDEDCGALLVSLTLKWGVDVEATTPLLFSSKIGMY
nr:hypothetical protein [Tanacetum cinerariifolium]